MMKKTILTFCGTLAAVLGLVSTGPAGAQDAWPTKPVRMIMPFPAGSGTDVLARLIADQLSRKWPHAVTVDNMSGAGGNIGGQTVTRAAPDGHTLLFVPAPPLVINQFMYKSTGYDPAKLAPITMIGSVPYAMVTRKDFPASTMKEFVAYAKANPGKVTYASSSVGSTAQLAALQLSLMNGLDMVHVPFRGAAPALNDVAGGHVDMVFDVVTTAQPMWEAGNLKALGTGGDKRSRIMPTVPTIDEAGYPGFRALTWFAMVAPPGTPSTITDKIYRDTVEAVKAPDVAARIAAMGVDVAGLSPDESGKFFAQESALWGKIIKEAGITLD